MKKLLILLLGVFLFISCTDLNPNEFIVKKVESKDNKTTFDVEQITAWHQSSSVKIITIKQGFDSTSKFLAGDTLILIKKSDYLRLKRQTENDSIKPNQIKKK